MATSPRPSLWQLKQRSLIAFLGFAVALYAPSFGTSDLTCEIRFSSVAHFAPPLRPLESLDRLKVASYNLENFFRESDVEHQNQLLSARPGFRSSIAKPRDKVLGIARNILRADPDLLVVQEAGSLDALQMLSESLGNRYHPILIPGNDNQGSRHIGFLVKKDLPVDLTLESHRTIRAFARDLPALVIRPAGSDSGSKPLLIFMGTHYKAGGKVTRSRRLEESQKTVEVMTTYKTQYGENVNEIVAGDFNGAAKVGSEYEPLRKEGQLSDAFDVARTSTPPHERNTHVIYRRERAGHFGWQPDSILVGPTLRDKVIKTRVLAPSPIPETQQEMDLLSPSDHFLLETEIDFSPVYRQWEQSTKYQH